MSVNRVKLSILAVGAAVLATAATGCNASVGEGSGGGSSQPAQGGSTSNNGANGSGNGSGNAGGNENSSGNHNVPVKVSNRCTAAALHPELTKQNDAGGVATWLLAVTNNGSRTCTLYGYPSFGLKNAAGDLFSDSKTVYVQHPGAATSITLRPGRTAFAGVKWTFCSGGDLIGGLVLTPPGERANTPVNLEGVGHSQEVPSLRLCSHSVTAGTFQPSSQGVVFPS